MNAPLSLTIEAPERLAALDAFTVLDTPPEAGFDDIVHLACRLCQVPVALVSLVDRDRQWFKARVAFLPTETDLDRSVCKYVLGEPDVVVFPDLAADPRTRDNPLVTGDPHIRFYAGAPLRTVGGHSLGSLCVIDTEPRPEGLTPQQVEDLRRLAGQVMMQLEMRRALAARDDLLAEQHHAQRARDALARTQAEIAAADGEQGPILRAILAGAMAAVPAAEGGVVELVDGDALSYHTTAGSLAPHQGERAPLNGSTSGACYRTRTPILLEDASHDERVSRPLQRRINLGSAVHAPIVQGRRAIGVLKLQAASAGAFTSRDLEQVTLFAGAATAGLTAVSEAAAQRAIQTSEARYRTIFESAIDFAIVVTDRDGVITEWNTGAERVLGWSAEEMIGQDAERFFTPEDRAAGRIASEMRGALKDGRASDERWHLRKGGERFFASGEMMPLRDPAGAHLGFIKILRDRTEQHQAGKALERAADQLRRAQEAGGVGVFSVGIADGILHASPEFCRIYGVPEEAEIPAGVFEKLVIPEDRTLVSTESQRRAGQFSFDVEYRIRRANDGALRWIARRGELERDPEGRPTVFTGVARDVTERRQAEEALRESDERMSLAFTASHAIGWFDWDVPNDVVRASETFARMYSVEPALAADGAPIAVFLAGIHLDDREHVGREVEAAMTLRQPYDTEYRLRAADGTVTWVHALGRVSYGVEGTPLRFTGIATDITASKLAVERQAALLELSIQLRECASAHDVALAGARIVGETLGVGRVGFGTVGADAETFVVEEDWTAPGFPSLAGRYRMSEYGAYADNLRRGELVIIPDVREDARTSATAATLERVSVRALINLPIVERQTIVAVLYVNSDQPRSWSDTEVAFARQAADLMRQAIERRRAEDQQRLLNQELSHRLKNILAMVQAVATQTLRNAPDPETARDALAARLIALSKAHDVLMAGTGQSAPLREVIAGTLQVHDVVGGARFRIAGPMVPCGARPALSVALMMHELATNAAKYGALSNATGRIDIRWAVEGAPGQEVLTLAWQEHGGPSVVPPMRKGFGSRLIERGLAGAVGGEVSLRYLPEGVRCVLTAPVSGFQSET